MSLDKTAAMIRDLHQFGYSPADISGVTNLTMTPAQVSEFLRTARHHQAVHLSAHLERREREAT